MNSLESVGYFIHEHIMFTSLYSNNKRNSTRRACRVALLNVCGKLYPLMINLDGFLGENLSKRLKNDIVYSL